MRKAGFCEEQSRDNVISDNYPASSKPEILHDVTKNPQENAYQFSMFKLDGLHTETPKKNVISVSIKELKHYLGCYSYSNVSTDISTVFYIQLFAYKNTM